MLQKSQEPRNQKLSFDPNLQYFLKSTAVQVGGVLPYKWEAYCSGNGRCTVGFPFLRGLEARKVQRYKWGGVLPYKWGVYCSTFWTGCTGWGFLKIAQEHKLVVSMRGGWDLLEPPVDDSPAEQNCVDLEVAEEVHALHLGTEGNRA